MGLDQSSVPSHYPDVSKRDGIHQLRKGDLIADPTRIDVEAVRKVAEMSILEKLEFRLSDLTDDTFEVDGSRPIWSLPSDLSMPEERPIDTIGEVLKNDPDLVKLAKSEKLTRTETVIKNVWEQLEPLVEENFSTPEQLESFLKMEKGLDFKINLMAGVKVLHVPWRGNRPDSEQEKDDRERDAWFDSEILDVIRESVINLLLGKGFNVKAQVPRWSSGMRGKRNRVCKDDIIDKKDEIITRNFAGWLMDALQIHFDQQEGTLSLYLPTFIPDREWDHTSKEPSHYRGFISLEVTEGTKPE